MSKNSCRFFIPSNNCCCCNINKIDENVFETHNQIGATGATGADLNLSMRSAYLATFINLEDKDIEVANNANIPITRVELDPNKYCSLDNANNIIKFSKIGWYKISFIVNAYVPFADSKAFNPKTDLVSIGVREVGTDNIFIGGTQWIYDEKPLPIIAQGIIAVPRDNMSYELANLSNRNIFLLSPKIETTLSYFPNLAVSIIIEYLGRN